MPRGITKATNTRRLHGLCRNRLEARMLAMNSTQLERMPLHSWASTRVVLAN
jgi:hypothetical protein